MYSRRRFIQLSGASGLMIASARPGFALGGTAAISAPMAGPARIRMRARSISENTHWGIYVQEVVVRDSRIVPVALIACFEFGRKQDPFVYPELTSALLPLVTPDETPYKIAVYFFENRDASLQPHADAALLANRFEEELDPLGRTSRMRAAYWDNAALPTAVIHEIDLIFQYEKTAVH